jgi:hypothetical protein
MDVMLIISFSIQRNVRGAPVQEILIQIAFFKNPVNNTREFKKEKPHRNISSAFLESTVIWGLLRRLQ